MIEQNHPPKIVASILNWNASEAVLRLVDTIYALNYEEINIVVIDNKSTDDSAEIFRHQLKKAHVIFSDSNDGYAAGHSLALDYARDKHAELLWLLNADVRFVNDCVLSELVNVYQSNPNAIYGSLQLRYSDEGDLLYPSFVEQLDGIFHFKNYATESQTSKSTFEVDWSSGFSILIPLAVIKKFGFMDTNFFLYSEESDYSWRMREVGVKTYIVLASQIIHEKHGSTNNAPRLTAVLEYYRMRNQFLLFRRQKGFLRFFMLMVNLSHLWNIALILRIILFDVALDDIETINKLFRYRAWRDAMLNRYGKTLDPERYLSASDKSN